MHTTSRSAKETKTDGPKHTHHPLKGEGRPEHEKIRGVIHPPSPSDASVEDPRKAIGLQLHVRRVQLALEGHSLA